jgi:fused signal recognition particle receptor
VAKTSFGEKVRQLFGIARLGEDFYEGLADSLIEGDLGAKHAYAVVEELQRACKEKKLDSEASVKAELKSILLKDTKQAKLELAKGGTNLFLVLGVNGVGKTTTIAKLGKYYSKGLPPGAVILAAGDTFRAAAIDQLEIHGERLGMRVVRHQSSSDPGAVIFDAIEAGAASGASLILADTAGRLHNKAHLVKELEKINKVISSKIDPARYKKLLVLDATTGQNGLRQAEVFSQAIGIDAIVITKYDSSAKGGLALAVSRELKIPTAFVCSGEGYDDIRPFESERYVSEFIGEA